MDKLIAKFTLEEQESIKAVFSVNFTPSKVSQLENDLGFVEKIDLNSLLIAYATKLEVMQMIASIPQFKTEVVDELPLVGEKMTLYLVPKNGQENDIYDEYVWVEETQSFEFLGTMALDLSNYLTPEKLGISKVSFMTEAEYEKLETKEANTLYLIEEENA